MMSTRALLVVFCVTFALCGAHAARVLHQTGGPQSLQNFCRTFVKRLQDSLWGMLTNAQHIRV
jgi:hypothetical protein